MKLVEVEAVAFFLAFTTGFPLCTVLTSWHETCQSIQFPTVPTNGIRGLPNCVPDLVTLLPRINLYVE
ncbi:hypothetical protein L915_01908 [Phytophthora nicotianae]|uniref:Uncharacterized protein n=1 Tax=Phytophthora nicotianae TaxID=4792 RepID=W2HIM3_PHYNI|nr:hypothetical protein L915_01908 [Phytophthora nicotianae]